MWLASVSKRKSDGSPIPTARWAVENSGTRRHAERLIEDALRGVGDPTRERQFRMPITLCRHRGLSDAEIEDLPAWWKAAPAIDTAGPPLELQWSRGIRESLSSQPCRDPARQPFGADPELYLIVPCGRCDSCVARREA